MEVRFLPGMIKALHLPLTMKWTREAMVVAVVVADAVVVAAAVAAAVVVAGMIHGCYYSNTSGAERNIGRRSWYWYREEHSWIDAL
jgi:hypothetical protein